MCGRYSQSKRIEQLEEHYHRQLEPGFRTKYEDGDYNVAPSRQCPVVLSDNIRMMRWGLVPHWAKSLNVGYSLINAMGETLLEKPTFKNLIKSNRCLVPATGYYEWLDSEGGKIPYYYYLPDREVFSFAGLWTTKIDAEGQPLESFTIITTKPNALTEKVHNRMPAILSVEEESIWIDSKTTDPNQVLKLIKPYPAEKMSAYKVSKLVGSVTNNSEQLIQRIE